MASWSFGIWCRTGGTEFGEHSSGRNLRPESVNQAKALNPEPVDDLLLGSDLPFVLKAWVSDLFCWLSS